MVGWSLPGRLLVCLCIAPLGSPFLYPRFGKGLVHGTIVTEYKVSLGRSRRCFASHRNPSSAECGDLRVHLFSVLA
jgi:hypothetical protein